MPALLQREAFSVEQCDLPPTTGGGVSTDNRLQAHRRIQPMREFPVIDVKLVLFAARRVRKAASFHIIEGKQSERSLLMRIQGVRKALYQITSDKPQLDRKALQLKRSLEEVKGLLGKIGRTSPNRKMPDKKRRK